MDDERPAGPRLDMLARMRELPPLNPHRCGVFTLAEAVAAGWTRDALRHAVAVGRIERIRTGCYASAPSVDLNRFAVADLRLAREAVVASLAIQGASVSHLAAAFVAGLPFWAPEPRACVTTRTGLTRSPGVHVHRSDGPDEHFGTTGGVAITSPERTVVDVTREFGVEAGLVVADAAARHGLIRRAGLSTAIAAVGRHADVSAAMLVAETVDPRSESPLESRSRWHLMDQGIFPPWTQVDILTLEGVFVGRTDLYWREGVVGEVDGSAKYRADQGGENLVLGAEKWRQEQLEDLDLEVVRWGSRHLRDFRPTAGRLRRAFSRAATHSGPRRWIAVPSATMWF